MKLSERRIGGVPAPLLVVAVVLVGLVATVVQVIPRSQAADTTTYGDVKITPKPPEAMIKDGTTDVCIIYRRTVFAGKAAKIKEFADAMSKTAGGNGTKVEIVPVTGPAPDDHFNLILSYEFPLSQWSIAPSQCSIDELQTAGRGRSTLELPKWARGMIAAAANVTVYVSITFAVMALFSFLAPEFEVYGLMISGCLGGFASNIVSNLINQVPLQANLTYAAMQCVSGIIQNVTVAKTVTAMMKAIRTWLGTEGNVAGLALVENLGIGESSRRSIESILSRLSLDLAATLPGD